MDEPEARPDPHLTDATIEHELRMVGEAVDAVCTGRFPSITLAGLRFADELLPRARELALVRHVEVRPLFHPGAHGSDLQIKRTREPSPAR